MNPVTTANNNFCGPAVISSIAGISTDEAEKLFQRNRNNYKPVRGVWPEEIDEVLRLLGYKVEHIKGYAGYSLFAVLTNLSTEGEYIFTIPHHVIVIEIRGKMRFICDNHTKKPINAGMSARLSQKVIRIVKVSRNDR